MTHNLLTRAPAEGKWSYQTSPITTRILHTLCAPALAAAIRARCRQGRRLIWIAVKRDWQYFRLLPPICWLIYIVLGRQKEELQVAVTETVAAAILHARELCR